MSLGFGDVLPEVYHMLIDFSYIILYWADIFMTFLSLVAMIAIGIVVVANRVKPTKILGVSFIIAAIGSLFSSVNNVIVRYVGVEIYAKYSSFSAIAGIICSLVVALCLCIYIHKSYGKKYIYIPIMLLTVAAPVATVIVNLCLTKVGNVPSLGYWISLVHSINDLVVNSAKCAVLIVVLYKNRLNEKIIPHAWIVFVIKLVSGIFISGFYIFSYSMIIATDGMPRSEISSFASSVLATSEKAYLVVGIISSMVALAFPLYVIVMVCKKKASAETENTLV